MGTNESRLNVDGEIGLRDDTSVSESHLGNGSSGPKGKMRKDCGGESQSSESSQQQQQHIPKILIPTKKSSRDYLFSRNEKSPNCSRDISPKEKDSPSSGRDGSARDLSPSRSSKEGSPRKESFLKNLSFIRKRERERDQTGGNDSNPNSSASPKTSPKSSFNNLSSSAGRGGGGGGDSQSHVESMRTTSSLSLNAYDKMAEVNCSETNKRIIEKIVEYTNNTAHRPLLYQYYHQFKKTTISLKSQDKSTKYWTVSVCLLFFSFSFFLSLSSFFFPTLLLELTDSLLTTIGILVNYLLLLP
jgi:hypothetical protein